MKLQQVIIDEDKSIFIKDFNKKTGELTFRSSIEPKLVQKESIVIEKDMIYTNLYMFHKSFLDKFLK